MDISYRKGADGNPANNTDPVGGAVDAVIDEAVANNLIYQPVITATAGTYRGIGYRQNDEATDSLVDARFTNRAGGIPPAASGLPILVSTSSEDTGTCWLAYKHGSAWVPVGQEIVLAGVVPVSGLVTMDMGTDWVLICKNGVPKGDVSLSVEGEKLGVVWGNPSAIRPGTFSACTLFEVAVATAQDAAISCADRLTDPASGVGTFVRATKWGGADNSVAIPGADLAAGSYIGYCVRMTVPAGMTKPYGNQVQSDITLFPAV